jgi:hypothetical protein
MDNHMVTNFRPLHISTHRIDDTGGVTTAYMEIDIGISTLMLGHNIYRVS